MAAGSLVVAASTLAHGLTATPGRVFHRRVAGPRGQDERFGAGSEHGGVAGADERAG